MSAAKKKSSAPALLAPDDVLESLSRKVVPLRPSVQATRAGRLAGTVERLRLAEDEMAAIVCEADKALLALDTDGVLDAAGFLTPAEFEERVSGSMEALHAMRTQGVGDNPSRRRRSRRRDRREGTDRSRRTEALESIAQTLRRMRELDTHVRRKIDAARALLSEIETLRLYEECGYVTFEEFLDRAIGPSPVLAASTNALGESPLAPPEDKPVPASDLRPSESFDDLPAAFSQLPAIPAGDPLPRADDAGHDDSLPPVPIRRAPRIVFTIVISFACAVLGGAAGFWSNRQTASPARVQVATSSMPAHSPTNTTP
jgi:hypothetical protein